MPNTFEDPEIPQNVHESGKKIALSRLSIGLLQGFTLFFLYKLASEKIWPAGLTFLFIPLLLVATLLPIILISTLGHARLKLILIWGSIAAIVLLLLGFYDFWRVGFSAFPELIDKNTSPFLPNFSLIFGLVVAFSIAQALVLSASADGKPIANYATYFDRAWKCAVQMLFAAIFIVLLWLVLELGALLFGLVKLDFLQHLLAQRWFFIPVTTVAFSFAFHLTDVRPNIVKGIRTLLLVLLSWLLPLAVLIVSGFLFSLLWIGMVPLWTTRHAASVLLWSAVTLIVLINAAYQNGSFAVEVARILRVSARIACLLLLPIALITIYAVAARVQEYGWTASRVIAAAALLIIGFYTAGYCRAAFSRDGWLKQVARTNIFAAIFIIIITLLLLSPIGDPAHIAVASQLHQLEDGKTNPTKFDFIYLRFNGARYGLAALRKLSASSEIGTSPQIIREAADAALKQTNPRNTGQMAVKTAEPAVLTENLHVFPPGKSLPASFLNQHWTETGANYILPACFKLKGKSCTVYFADLGDGTDKNLLLFSDDNNPLVFEQASDGNWKIAATLPLYQKECRSQLQQALESGHAKTIEPQHKDIEFQGQRVRVTPFGDTPITCKPAPQKSSNQPTNHP